MDIKCGIGFDAHKFSEGRKLIIGGVKIPYKLGLAGHSDADVLIHAVIDCLAGPALGKDIGNLFPDSDMKYKDIDSKILLAETVKLLEEKKWKISGVDAVIIAQEPKMIPYIPEMRRVMAGILRLNESDMTIKATTTEYMGFTGRKEGVAAAAVSTLVRG